MVPGDKVHIDVAAKGGGSESKSKFKMMNASDSIVDWVLDMVPQMGAGWCPTGMLGIGIGGTGEKTMVLAQQFLVDTVELTGLLRVRQYSDTEAVGRAVYKTANHH